MMMNPLIKKTYYRAITATATACLVAICFSSRTAYSQELTRLSSPNVEQGGTFGSGVAIVPDVDGDGVEDLAVGARMEDGGALNSGRAYLFSGANGELLHSFVSPNPESSGNFGHSVAGVADVDGDGRGEVLVGALYELQNTVGGRSYLFSGSTGALLRTFVSPVAGASNNFGQALSGVPDVNGDGVVDIVIAAPNQLVDNNRGAGSVYVFDGASGSLLRTINSPDLDSNHFFGSQVAGVDDLDGDGFGDLVIGDYQSAASTGGRVRIYSGATGVELYPLDSPGAVPQGGFGRNLAGVPDVNGDGWGDFVVGADGEPSPSTNEQFGRAYVFSGVDGSLLHTLTSPNPSNQGRLGSSVTGVTDVNGDGRGDILVGTREDGGATFAGTAYLFSGADGAVLESYVSDQPEAAGFFGSRVAGANWTTGNASAHIVSASSESVGGLADAGNIYYAAATVALAVNSTGDDDDSDPNDGLCTTGNLITRGDGSEEQECTLRAAITHTNALGGDRITFNIDGDGPHRIEPATALPPVTEASKIDATTQPGYSDEPIVIIDGSNAGTGVAGLRLQGSGASVSGLGIDGFDGDGISVEATGVTIARNYIGADVGNSGHGIHAIGTFDNLTIGMESDPMSGNTIGNSGGNGIYLEGPDESQVGKAGVRALIGIRINFNLVGALFGPLDSEASPIGNVLSGVVMKNVAGSTLFKNTVANNLGHGIEMLGQLTTGNTLEGNDVGGWFMRESNNTITQGLAMGNGLSGIFMHTGALQNLIGKAGGRPNTVVSNGRYGLRMLNAQGNSVLNSLFGIPKDSLETFPQKNGSSMIAFGNLLGGLCLESSGSNTIGMPGAGNIISNNGSTLDHAGIILKGGLLNRVTSNIIGSNSLGHLLGNLGSGVLVTDGADETTIGGATEEEGNVIGGNTGNGIYLKGEPIQASMAKVDLAALRAGVTPRAAGTSASINLGNISHNLVGGMFVGSLAKLIPNQLNGLCMLNAFKNTASFNTFVANKKSGIEIMGPLSLKNIFDNNALGGLAKWSQQPNPEDVVAAGNDEHGVFMHTEASQNTFKGIADLQRQFALANKGYGFLFMNSYLNSIQSTSIGILRNLRGSAAKTAPDASGTRAINLGNLLGGICLQNSANNVVGGIGLGNIIANNGTDSTSAGIELLGRLTIGSKIVGNLLGTTPEGDAAGNKGPGVMINGASETTIGGLLAGEGNVIAGNGSGGVKGLLAIATKLLGNRIGLTPESAGGTAMPNDDRGISFEDSRSLEIGNNEVRSDSLASVRLARTRFGKLFNNLFAHFGTVLREPALGIFNSSQIQVGSARELTSTSASSAEGRNNIVAHEAVHVVQSDHVDVSGTDIHGAEDAAAGTEKAIYFKESTNVSAGSPNSGNMLDLNGGNGLVFEDSDGRSSSTTIMGANNALVLQQAKIQMKAMQIDASVRGILAQLNSRMEIRQSLIRNMSGSNSGIHMENSTGTITGTTITGDAGDAIWLSGSDPSINGNNISGSAGFGIRNVDPAITVNATGNWWGDATGPGGEGPGGGDEVSVRVDYGDWLDSEIGLVASITPDTLIAIPGDTVRFEATVQNLVLPSDNVDINLDDDSGWLVGQTAFAVATTTTPTAFSAVLAIPANAASGSTNHLSLSATSQTDTDLTASGSAVIVVATAEPTAVANVGPSEVDVSVSSNGPSGPSTFTITSNSASASASFTAYDASWTPAIASISDDRVLSPNSTVVLPTNVVSDAVWAFQTDAAPSQSSKAAAATGTYEYSACFDIAPHSDAIDDPNMAVILFRKAGGRSWSAVSTSSQTSGTTEFLCAEGRSEFGYYALATGTEAAPSAPLASFPENMRTGVASDLVFVWNEAIGALRYDFQLASDSLFADVVLDGMSESRYFTASELAVSTRYYWRVRSGTDLGFGPWSATSSFVTSDTGVGVEETTSDRVPAFVELDANYPNPFNDRTTIGFRLPDAEVVRIDIFDVRGRLIERLADSQMAAGEHVVIFDGSRHPSGIYLYRMMAGGHSIVRSMILVR